MPHVATTKKAVEKVVRPTQAHINDKFSVRYGNFGNIARPSWDFSSEVFQILGKDLQGFSVGEIAEELTTSIAKLKEFSLRIMKSELSFDSKDSAGK